MSESIPVAALFGFLLAMVRTAAWMALSPPFNTRNIPRTVKVGACAGISLAVAPRMPATEVTFDVAPLMALVFTQIATGLLLGFITSILFSAIEAAGSLIDTLGGFSIAQGLDPFNNNQASFFGRFYNLMATVLLFVTNGYLLLIKGFMTSFDAVPLQGVHLNQLTQVIAKDVSMLGLAAVEIAAPMLAAYFMADVAMGLLGKAAPQLNIFTFGPPLKILLTLLMVGSALPLLPGALHTLVGKSLIDGVNALHGVVSS